MSFRKKMLRKAGSLEARAATLKAFALLYESLYWLELDKQDLITKQLEDMVGQIWNQIWNEDKAKD